MGQRSTVIFVTGRAGSGKSYKRCAHYLIKEWLPTAQPSEQHWSNFPIMFEPWEDKNGVQQPGLIKMVEPLAISEPELRQRVKAFPPEMMKRWENAEYENRKGQGREPFGPWDDLADEDLSGVHIAIDECHHYCGEHSPPAVKRRWQKWLGELRHMGATIEFLSQHEAKVAKEIKMEAEIRYEIVNGEHRPDPLIGFKMYTWYNIKAKLGFGWKPYSWQIEKRQEDGKWISSADDEEAFPFDPWLYGAYDTNAGPIAGGKAGTTGKKPYELYSWPAFILWILTYNSKKVTAFAGFAAAIFGFIFFREHLIKGVLWFMLATIPQTAGMKKKPAIEKPVLDDAQVKQTLEASETKINVRSPEEARKLAELIEHDLQLQIKVGKLEADLSKLQEEKQELETKVQHAFALASLTTHTVTFRGGYTYAIGEIIDWGPYEKKSLQTIDYRKRTCTLNDGTILRMGIDSSIKLNPSLVSKLPVSQLPLGNHQPTSTAISTDIPGTPNAPTIPTATTITNPAINNQY